jgi:uracil-DNA glycosylase
MSKIMKSQLGDWYPMLLPILQTKTFQKIAGHIRDRRAAGVSILPDTSRTFKAFRLCPLSDVRVVILGQDPYHDGSATGLAFANRTGTRKVSPSLKNIITAVETDYGTKQGVNVKGLLDVDITLESWARQGVLLLNTALSVEKGKAGSHTDLWKPFTKMIIEALSLYRNNLVFVLWGKKAQEYETYIRGNNTILKAAHPAAESYSGGRAGFFTCGHFNRINQIVSPAIEWNKSNIVEYEGRN